MIIYEHLWTKLGIIWRAGEEVNIGCYFVWIIKYMINADICLWLGVLK